MEEIMSTKVDGIFYRNNKTPFHPVFAAALAGNAPDKDRLYGRAAITDILREKAKGEHITRGMIEDMLGCSGCFKADFIKKELNKWSWGRDGKPGTIFVGEAAAGLMAIAKSDGEKVYPASGSLTETEADKIGIPTG
jgi:hypothetical protein